MFRKYAQISFLLEEQGPFAPRLEQIRQIIQQPDFHYDKKSGADFMENIFLDSSYWLRFELFDDCYLYKKEPQNLLPEQNLHLQMVDLGVAFLNKGFPLKFKPKRYTQQGPDNIASFAKVFSEQCHKRRDFLRKIKTKHLSFVHQQRERE